MSFVIGESVQVQYSDKLWYPATITQTTPKINITWRDGGKAQLDVKPDQIRLVHLSSSFYIASFYFFALYSCNI